MPREELEWALDELRNHDRLREYGHARSYYAGEHRLQFATEKFKTTFGKLFSAFADNLCPAIIDSLVDRLAVTGFVSSSDRNAASGDTIQPADELGTRAWQVWERNQMDLRANAVYMDALLTGDGYVIVEPNIDQLATIWPQPPEQIAVAYDEQQPGRVGRAAKWWVDAEGYVRLTIYYPDRVERYRSVQPEKKYRQRTTWRVDDFQWAPRAGLDERPNVQANPYGRVPVFHLPNKRIYEPGVSELADVIPIQDALNKALMDMLVAMEFSSFRQRWATGLAIEQDEATGKPIPPPFDYGADRMFATSNPEARFGEFAQTDLGQFLEVQESLRSEMARVSGTPLHYLFITRGDFPSGEAMKSAEARFTKKIKDRQTAFGNVWEQALTFALELEGAELPAGFQLRTVWEPASPRSEREIIETILMKQTLGVPREQLLKELGYDDQLIAQMVANIPPDGEEEDGPDVIVPTSMGRMKVDGTAPPAVPG